ncbi:MAG: metal-dependent hydrolase [Elusimicrobia bacterium]|nr:metal-dependent hydrolase [Elusimicrobiota bacterium]
MENLTHTLSGLVVANAFFRRRLGPEAAPILAVASNLPDIDVLVHLTADPLAIASRRTFGHSLILLPVWTLILAWLFKRRYPQHSLPRLFGLCAVGGALHLLFDLINSFGVVLLWPLSLWRPELAIVFIIDLILTGLLLMPWALARFLERRQRAFQLSAVLAASYLLFCFANRALAQRLLARQSRSPDFSYVFPEPLGPHRWRGVLRHGERYSLFLIRTLSGEIEPRGELITHLSDAGVKRARDSERGRRLEAFFKAPVWQAGLRPEVSVYDLRFRSLLIRRASFEFFFPPQASAGSVPP